jgi:hypothetical protein
MVKQRMTEMVKQWMTEIVKQRRNRDGKKEDDLRWQSRG